MLGRAGFIAIGAALASTAVALAAPLPGGVKLVGASCSKPIEFDQSVNVLDARQGPVHAYDDHWIKATITRTPSASGVHEVISWTVDPAVQLCHGSSTRIGSGAQKVVITGRDGSRAGDLPSDGQTRVILRAQFIKPIKLRDGLGPSRLRTLVAGWSKRSCSLKSTEPKAAKLLKDLALRAGATTCKAVKHPRGDAGDLLHHLSAFLNNADPKDGAAIGPEYYRVLGQLTTYRP